MASHSLVLADLPRDADPELVSSVVRELNALCARHALAFARAVGEVLLDRFFEGSFEIYHARAGNHPSLRALVDHADLDLSHAQLWTSMAVLEQLRQLPEALGQRLSLHHHKALLPLKDPKLKQELAEAAVREGLSYRELGERVQHARVQGGETQRVGRPPLPAWAKALRRVERALVRTRVVEVARTDFAHFEPEEARQLIDAIDQRLLELQQLKNRVLKAAADLDGGGDRVRLSALSGS